MCEPTSIAMGVAAAAALAGSVAKSQADKKVRQASDEASSAELLRQQGFRDQSYKAFDTSLGNFEKPKQDANLESERAARTEAGKNNVNIGTSLFTPSARAPAVISDAYKRAGDEASAASSNYAGAYGNLTGYGDLSLKNDVALGRSREDIGQYSNFARGSSNVLPLELQAAQGKGEKELAIGDALMGVSSIASMYGFTQPATKGVTVPGGRAVLKSAGTIPGLRF